MFHLRAAILCLVFGRLVSSTSIEGLKLCSRTETAGIYAVSSGGRCRREAEKEARSCAGEAFKIDDGVKSIPVSICQMTQTNWETVNYFFGATTHDISTVEAPAPQAVDCMKWSQNYRAGEIGVLEKSGDGKFQTKNVPKLKYTWPKGETGFVQNAILLQTSATYNYLDNVFIGPHGPMPGCDITAGSCIVGTNTYVWKVPEQANCLLLTSLGNHTAEIHLDAEEHPHRVEFPSMGMSWHSWYNCSLNSECFDQNTICTSGMAFRLADCKDVFHASAPSEPESRPSSSSSHIDPAIRPGLNHVKDQGIDAMREMTTDINYVECEMEKKFDLLFDLLAQQYPSEILSHLLGEKVSAISAGDLQMELLCEEVNATLLPTLQHQSYFSRRPLVRFTTKTNRTAIGQLLKDGSIIEGTPWVENYTPGRTVTFEIAGKFYLFQNYSLVASDITVERLHSSFSKVSTNINRTDYVSALPDLTSEGIHAEDIISLQIAISQSANIISAVQNFIEANTMEQTTDASLNFDFLTGAVTNLLFRVLSEITSPVLSVIILILFFASLIYTALATILGIKYICSFVKSHAKRSGKQRKPTRYAPGKKDAGSFDV